MTAFGTLGHSYKQHKTSVRTETAGIDGSVHIKPGGTRAQANTIEKTGAGHACLARLSITAD